MSIFADDAGGGPTRRISNRVVNHHMNYGSTFNFRVSFSKEKKSCTRRCSKLYVKFSDFRRENIAFMFSTLYEHTRCLGLRPEPFAPYRILCQKSRGLPRSEVRCRDRGSLMTWSMIAIDFNDRRFTIDDRVIMIAIDKINDRDRQNSWSMIDTASWSTIDMFTNPQVTFGNITSKTKVFFANKFECVTFSWKVTSKE